jgi:hypothetical protein
MTVTFTAPETLTLITTPPLPAPVLSERPTFPQTTHHVTDTIIANWYCHLALAGMTIDGTTATAATVAS